MSFKVIIVDDEPPARTYLSALLKNCPDMEVVAECTNGLEAVDAIQKHHPDLVFLDVQMPEMSGFDVLGRIDHQTAPQIIFVTAFDKYAIDAFELHAIDYLLKPFNQERFEKSLSRARERLNRRVSDDLANRLMTALEEYRSHREGMVGTDSNKDVLRRIPVRMLRKTILVDVDDIDWIEASDDFVNLHCGTGKHLLYDTMNNLEQKLDPDRFVRIHRGAIVNIDRVTELRSLKGGDYEVLMQGGVSLRLSRRRKKNLESLLGRSF